MAEVNQTYGFKVEPFENRVLKSLIGVHNEYFPVICHNNLNINKLMNAHEM